MTTYEFVAPGSLEYVACVAYLPYTLPSRPPFSDTFQISAEVTWRRINEQDRRYRLDEGPEGAPPTDRLHSQECGILLAPFGNETLGHMLSPNGRSSGAVL